MIKELKIWNLYGKDYNINFNEDLTIFYGKNGSGKTSILNIIQLLLEGDIKKVCGFSFDALLMEIIINKNIKVLRIEQKENHYFISFDGIEYKISKVNNNLDAIYYYKSLEDTESSSNSFENSLTKDWNNVKLLSVNDEDEKKRSEVSQFFKKEMDYIYIPINRKVKKSSDRNPINNKYGIERSNKKNIEDSLKIAESYFKEFKNQINRVENIINTRIRNQVFNQLSRPIVFEDIANFEGINNLNFNGLEIRLAEVFGEEIGNNIKELSRLFHKTNDSYEMRDNQLNVIDAKNFITHTFTIAQLKKLQNVIDATETKNQTLINLKTTYNEIFESVNILFEETGKKIGYDNRNQKLYFSNINSSEKLDMSLLSSGEKQLVIFFIFSLIEYRSKNSSILLIDEPELSLHIEWQEKLLPSILNKNSKKQIILATHSPDIIGDFIEKCVEIKGVLL